jgi:putative drug exporter of the RND superfamily
MPGTRRRTDKEGGALSRGFAAALVRLRFLVPILWIAAALAATLELPQLGTESTGALDDVIADDSEATRAAQASTQRFGFPLTTDTVVVQRNPDGLSIPIQKRLVRAALRTSEGRAPSTTGPSAAIPITNSPGDPLGTGGNATTAMTYLSFAPNLSVEDRTDMAASYASNELGGESGDVVGVTGAAPGRQAEFDAIEDGLPLIEVASVVAVLVVVGLAFRSVLAPLATLFTGGIAFLLVVRVVPWVGEGLGVAIPAEVQPVLIVLLLGLVTDYSVFFLSAMRRRLKRGDPTLTAARDSIADTAPLVLTAGLIVAAGTAALMVGQLDFFRAFGPGLAITTLIALVVAGTMVPALVAVLGPRLFGRGLATPAAAQTTDGPREDAAAERVREETPPDGTGGPKARAKRALARPLVAFRRMPRLEAAAQTARWRVALARLASARPVAVVIAALTIAVLLLAASGLRKTELGVTFIRGLPDDTEAKQAADAAAAGFSPGALAPTEIDLLRSGIADERGALAELERSIAGQPGVSTVVGPAAQPPPSAPQVMISEDGGAARFAVVLDEDPLGAPAMDRLGELRTNLPALIDDAGLTPPPQVAFGGQTALADETVDSLMDDLRSVAIVALLANLLLLVLFLRALVAPLFLVAASVLGLAATLGLTTFFFQGVLGRDELTYYVPFAGAVLLIALGSDYNVFVAGRIWKEARWRPLPEAIAVATPAASRAITVAGLALAASFALLAIIPLDSFREFAFVMVVGVLIDTFVVRTLLVPALTSIFGERAWAPGPRIPPVSSEAFAERVADLAGISHEAAKRVGAATVTTLGERIGERERREVAERLPEPLTDCILKLDADPEPFPVDEFLSRVRERENGLTTQSTSESVRAVLEALEETVPGGLDYVRVQLSEDYDRLFT